MKKILASACLCGEPCRYDGKAATCQDPLFQKWLKEGRIVPVCPEVLGGLEIPRGACQRRANQVFDEDGRNVTKAFFEGGEATLALAREIEIEFCIFKQRSPSCGTNIIYDGTFSGTKIAGQGVTTEILRNAGYLVFGEDEMDEIIKMEEQIR